VSTCASAPTGEPPRRQARGASTEKGELQEDGEARTTALHAVYRWWIEVVFRDAKQLFGLADSPAWSEQAVRRVAPLVGLLLSALVVWFVDVFDSPVATLPIRPWYTQKKDLCFADILRAARRTLEGVDVLAWDANPLCGSPEAQPHDEGPPTARMPGFDVPPLAA
jgi:hypothetical protein